MNYALLNKLFIFTIVVLTISRSLFSLIFFLFKFYFIVVAHSEYSARPGLFCGKYHVLTTFPMGATVSQYSNQSYVQNVRSYLYVTTCIMKYKKNNYNTDETLHTEQHCYRLFLFLVVTTLKNKGA